MASGEPYLDSYGDRLIAETVGGDPLIRTYLPGGAFGVKPDETVRAASMLRFWLQSPGAEKFRQDGGQGRVLSTPTYVVVALDRQTSGDDRVYGTVGGPLGLPYLQLAQARIYALLHGRTFRHGGFEYEATCRRWPPISEITKTGRDVQVGWLVSLNVQ